jgi:hypothetical protein
MMLDLGDYTLSCQPSLQKEPTGFDGCQEDARCTTRPGLVSLLIANFPAPLAGGHFKLSPNRRRWVGSFRLKHDF